MVKSYVERVDERVMDAVIRAQGHVSKMMPSDTTLQSVLNSSFMALTPELQVQLVEMMGTEWYLDLAAKIEKQLRKFDGVL